MDQIASQEEQLSMDISVNLRVLQMYKTIFQENWFQALVMLNKSHKIYNGVF